MGDDLEAGKNQRAGDYAVGRCRTPQHTRWKKGQSGNPKGRPRRRLSGDIAECTNSLLAEAGWVEIGGKRRRVTNAEKLALVRIKEALQQKPGAARDVYRWQQDYQERNPVEEETVIECRLVFDNEEDRGWNKLASEKEALEQQVKQLQAQLAARGSPQLLPPPGSPGDSD